MAFECLTCLYDFAADARLRRLTQMMLDLLLADMAVDSLDGMYCGAQGRIYPRHALDHATEDTLSLQYLYFGLGDPALGHALDPLLSSFRPSPQVVQVALGRTEPYRNRERKHLHLLGDVLPEHPIPGSIRKCTWWTPDYALGCVQHRDAYPDPGSATYAHHQEHGWDLTFAGRTDRRLFTHHPGVDKEHNHWTGDRLCGCGRFLQHRSTLLALYDIAPGQACQFIHAYVPAASFDEVIEEGGAIFVRAGLAAAALIILPGYVWTTAGEWAHREVVAAGPRHAVVCEAGTIAQAGDFAALRGEILGNHIDYDASARRLAYHSRRNGHLELGLDGQGSVDRMPIDLDHGTYDSPHVRSAWGSGIISIGSPDDPLVLDFPAVERS